MIEFWKEYTFLWHFPSPLKHYPPLNDKWNHQETCLNLSENLWNITCAITKLYEHNCSSQFWSRQKRFAQKILSSSFHCYYHYYHLTHLWRVEHSCSHSMITLSTSTAACMVFEGVEGQRRIVIVRIYLSTLVRVN